MMENHLSNKCKKIEDEHCEKYGTDPEYTTKHDARQAESIALQKQLEEQVLQVSIKAGRYTLEQAAKFIADNSKSSADSIYIKLCKSYKNRELILYAPNMDEAYNGKDFRGFYLEALWKDLNDWLGKNEPLLGCLFPSPEVMADAGVDSHTDKLPKQSASNTKDNEAPKPWLISDQRDLSPKQPWYTPARYFARQLVKDDSTLLTKRKLLAEKVVQSLNNVGIKKRGGIKPFDPNTVLKAFANISFD